MIIEILTVIAPVGLIAALGFVWDRRGLPFDTNMVALLVIRIGAPSLIISTLLENRPDPNVIVDMVFAALSLVFGVAVIAAIGLRLARQSMQVFLPALIFPNAGNMGIPLCLFAFGDEGLALSVTFFAAMALTQFTLGLTVASGRFSARDVVANPVLWATALSMVMLFSGAEFPRWIDSTVDVIAGLVIPLMLMSLGISLSRLKPSSLVRSTNFALSRLLVGFFAGIAVTSLLGLEGVAQSTVIIQASMPTAVFNYLFAVRYGNQPEEVAGIVVVSTLISFLTLPFLMAYALSLV